MRTFVFATAVLFAAGCAQVENTSIPTSERYLYELNRERIQLSESDLARLQASWKPIVRSAEPSQAQGPDRVRALNSVALLEERKFSCHQMESLEIKRESAGLLGLSMVHGRFVSVPSIIEEWKIRACEKYHWYLIIGDKGYIDVEFRQ